MRMESVEKWLLQPYPKESWKTHLVNAGWSSLFVTFFLIAFQPFGMKVEEEWFWNYALVCVYFGLTAGVTLLFAGAVMEIFSGIFNENKWVIWKEILANIVTVSLIGFTNLIFASFYFGFDFSWDVFLYWQKVTFAVGIFPVFFGAYIKQNKLQKKYTSGARTLNASIASHSGIRENSGARDLIQFTGENQHELLQLNASQVLYLEAADNYVRIFYVEEGTLKSQLLRSTLKNMEAQLAAHPQFFRCHRTYIVNLHHITHVSGNAQGYKLELKHTAQTVPVSRSLNQEIFQKIK